MRNATTKRVVPKRRAKAPGRRTSTKRPARASRPVIQPGRVRRRRVPTRRVPSPLSDETAAIQVEKHGMIEEAMEPVRDPGESDIERQ